MNDEDFKKMVEEIKTYAEKDDWLSVEGCVRACYHHGMQWGQCHPHA